MNQQQSWEANYPVKTFGNDDDGVIEIVTRVQDGTGTSEAGCYYGKKHIQTTLFLEYLLQQAAGCAAHFAIHDYSLGAHYV